MTPKTVDPVEAAEKAARAALQATIDELRETGADPALLAALVEQAGDVDSGTYQRPQRFGGDGGLGTLSIDPYRRP